MKKLKPLFTSQDWVVDDIERTWNGIDKVAKKDFGLDYYPVEIQIVSAEQMLDICSTPGGMPQYYQHWSYGKEYAIMKKEYEKGRQGLAYELVINTDPCIAYLMEDNTMAVQALVLAHASCGHNAFFKNNYLFKEWTDPTFIVPYLKYAKQHIKNLEEKWGSGLVTDILTACQALQWHGLDKYKPLHKRKEEIKEQQDVRVAYSEMMANAKWKVLKFNSLLEDEEEEEIDQPTLIANAKFPDDNILKFISKYSPHLHSDFREILKIVCNIEQYFYPNIQTKLMNEGFATFIHTEMTSHMEEKGLLTSGAYLEMLEVNSKVLYQEGIANKKLGLPNVYALGLAIFRDIKRIALNPVDEDFYYYPDLAGKKDWINIVKDIAYNFRDESFILQYLTPKVIRDFKLFTALDDAERKYYEVRATQSDEDISLIRQYLSDQYNVMLSIPKLSVAGVETGPFNESMNTLKLLYDPVHGRRLERESTHDVLSAIECLWRAPVSLHTPMNIDFDF